MNPSTQFTLPVEVRPADIDDLGHVNNVVYLRWTQEVATAHWQQIAPQAAQHQLVWVVRRHEIDYHRPASLDDSVELRTWVGQAEGLNFERHTEIGEANSDRVFATARTIWIPIDAKSGRPKRVSEGVRALFSSE